MFVPDGRKTKIYKTKIYKTKIYDIKNIKKFLWTNDVIERIICRGAFLFARVMLAQKMD